MQQSSKHNKMINFERPRGVTVSILDSESSDRGSNPREALRLPRVYKNSRHKRRMRACAGSTRARCAVSWASGGNEIRTPNLPTWNQTSCFCVIPVTCWSSAGCPTPKMRSLAKQTFGSRCAVEQFVSKTGWDVLPGRAV